MTRPNHLDQSTLELVQRLSRRVPVMALVIVTHDDNLDALAYASERSLDPGRAASEYEPVTDPGLSLSNTESVDRERREHERRSSAAPVAVVVTPAQNEAATIGDVVRAIVALGYVSVVIDDASSDATGERAGAAGAVVVRLEQSFGVGHALRRGFATAVSLGASAIVQCDGDGQHPVHEIPRLLGHRPDAALVIGSRFLAEEPLRLSAAKRAGIWLLRHRLQARVRLSVTDPTSGFRTIRQPLLSAFADDFPSSYLGDTFEACLAAAELVGPDRISEIGVEMRDRQGGVPFATGTHAAWLLVRALVGTSRLVRRPLQRIR